MLLLGAQLLLQWFLGRDLQESYSPQLEQDPSYLSLWWVILKGILNFSVRLIYLELGLPAATTAVFKTSFTEKGAIQKSPVFQGPHYLLVDGGRYCFA